MLETIAEERIEDPAILAVALEEVFGALHEREDAIRLLNKSQAVVSTGSGLKRYPVAADFDGLHIEDVEENVQRVMAAIEKMIGDGSIYVTGVQSFPHSTRALYAKPDWTFWADIDEFLSDAGYPDGWVEDRHIENTDLWYQLRDALLALRYYSIKVRFDGVRDLGYSPDEGFQLFEETPEEAIAAAWALALAFPGSGTVGYGLLLESFDPIEGDTLWDAGAFVAQSGSAYASGGNLFVGLVVEPWSWRWSAQCFRLTDTIEFSNSLGEVITLTGPTDSDEVEFEHVDPIAPDSVITFSVSNPSSPPGSPPFTLPGPYESEYDENAYATAGLVGLQTTIWKCDAQSAFAYT